MLTKSQQTVLVDKILNRPRMVSVTDSIDVKKAFGQDVPPREGRADSVAMFVDIAGFSQRIRGLQPEQVRQFLSRFYKSAIKAIDDRFGLIDRIVGDGILAVFSPFLIPQLQQESTALHALNTAEAIIQELHGSECESKAAIGCGSLLFCSTGLAGVYTDYTVLGHPLTHVYRMEELASANQVIVPKNSPAGAIIAAQLERSRNRVSPSTKPVRWTVDEKNVPLRGAEDLGILYVQTYE